VEERQYDGLLALSENRGQLLWVDEAEAPTALGDCTGAIRHFVSIACLPFHRRQIISAASDQSREWRRQTKWDKKKEEPVRCSDRRYSKWPEENTAIS
jgi:hypothetical protein